MKGRRGCEGAMCPMSGVEKLTSGRSRSTHERPCDPKATLAHLILLAKVSPPPGRIRPILADAEVRSSLGALLSFLLLIRVGNDVAVLTPRVLVLSGLAVAC